MPSYFPQTDWRTVTVTVDFTSGTWNTVNTHELFTVTGAVDVLLSNRCTTSMTDAADGGMISLGVETDPDLLITSTSFSAATGIDAGRFWFSNTTQVSDAFPPTTGMAPQNGAIIPRSIIGLDIGYEITVEAATGGVIEFVCMWRPSNGVGSGSVVAGAGGAL